ncbi:DgyrCDS8319 [Dimorphilus gyrociliatus]|uniref:DgyrCDS8319 n=1 Tax=Dimorphilus gyrociliatus TaxID=2664684 RepID=A0A7I8VUS1_9ANNE|nr:DgyrCDS8319 [Dimorphilus gyrociliatus]
MRRISRKIQLRHERERICSLMHRLYWLHEEDISTSLFVLNKMRESYLFDRVSELLVFSHKYRTHGMEIVAVESDLSCLPPKRNFNKLLLTVRKVERLFEALTMELPCGNNGVDGSISSAVGGTILMLALATSTLWCDSRAKMIRRLIHYLCGRGAAIRYERETIGDKNLAACVETLQYVDYLTLVDDHFVLGDAHISPILKGDLRNKIRYVDTVLASWTERRKGMANKEMLEAYYSARDICIRENIITSKANFPDIVEKVSDNSKTPECIKGLRHLLRKMTTPPNITKLENDEKFFQLIMHTHDALYTWHDNRSMLDIIERVRSNIYACLKGLSIDALLIDKELSKAKLEQLERELYKHLNYLTLKQVQRERRHYPADSTTLPTAESESSIYTIAPSGPLNSTKPCNKYVDESSIISSGSLYATAQSITSSDLRVQSSCDDETAV